MNVNVEGNLLAKFRKDERNISPWNQNPLNSWLSQALTHTSARYLQLYRKNKHGDPYFLHYFNNNTTHHQSWKNMYWIMNSLWILSWTFYNNDNVTASSFKIRVSQRGVVVYQYTRKKNRQIYPKLYPWVYFIPEIQRKWYTEYPYLSCYMPYTRFKKSLYTVYPKTLADPARWIRQNFLWLRKLLSFWTRRDWIILCVSGKLPTYSSPKPTLTITKCLLRGEVGAIL